jgi:predicted metal-dependent hydrolase
VAFPRGEVFFIETIKRHRADAPPKLEAEIRAFVIQEINHTREHVAFNKAARDAGYDLSGIEERLESAVEAANNRPPIANLAATMALEHFTAIMAHQQLKRPERFVNVPEELAEMWLWHAAEEIEHKAVAYDTWLHATRDWSRWKRWHVKSRLMLVVTRNFLRDRLADIHNLLEQDGLTGTKWNWRVLAYLLWRPGMLTNVFPAWLAFFLPGFHPWKLDDRHLIRKFDSEFTDAIMPAE